ncbi:peptide chain release factor N(5)-glutamine methyltransferase [Buchnera aphidicola]|uniref:peptide chain release factor N(5)-glutamine methyltransferase n=1 Tax=Buchnera aphidicola TaxID=9 RepID=UPI0021C74085|nr:peptide chain release factor N(5)-glutamine methyltransferase [Buchnera aphidicola (Stegophylla sp.)]
MKIQFWLQYISNLLYCFRTPQLDSEMIISYTVQQSRTWIYIFNNIFLSTSQIFLLNIFVRRRINCEPISYIIKKKEFWSCVFRISKYVLIPRKETEFLVQEILKRINMYDSVLDLGCGSGCISLSIAHERPYCNIIGIDSSLKSITLSKKNAKYLNINNVYFFYSNWFSAIKRKFNIIVSNPPYIHEQEIVYMNKDCMFEPCGALISRNHGFSDIEHIIKYAYIFLFNQGFLIIEHGWKQKEMVNFLFKKYNFFDVMSYFDFNGYYRITLGKKVY